MKKSYLEYIFFAIINIQNVNLLCKVSFVFNYFKDLSFFWI